MSRVFKALALASGLAASLASPLVNYSPLALERAEDGENECQDLDNCPHAYNNTQPDWDPSDPSGLVVDDSLAAFMNTTEAQYIAAFTKFYPPSTAAAADPTVFGGSAGRALLFLQRFEAWGQASDLATALEYIEGALASVGAVSASTCGFLWGRPGVGAVGAVVRSRAGDEAGAQSLVDALVGYFEKAPDDSECPYDDWDSGRAGLLYVSKFLDEMLPQWPGGLPVIDRDLLAPVALAIIDRGTRLSDSPGEYLEWLSPNDQGKWLGMSHGSAGVLHGLLLVPEVVLGNSTARRLILGTIDHIVAQQQPSGNFPSEYYAPDDDVLVQWDHGAPGVMAVLAEAALLFLEQDDPAAGDPTANVSAWVSSSLRAAECAWSRGLLTKGLMLCHGITGNTYMQLRLAGLLAQVQAAAAKKGAALGVAALPAFDPPRYTWRALQFQKFVAATPEVSDPALMRYPTPNPYVLYAGSFESGAYVFNDLLKHRNDPASACQAAYC